MPDLTPKQEAFVRAYIETGNASEAYRRAYDASRMKDTTVHVKASELLADGKVAVRLNELQEIHQKRHEVTVDRIINELARIGFADIRKAVKWHGHLVKEEDNPDGGDVLVIKNTYSNHVSLISSEDLDDDTAAAISEVSQSPTGGLKIKLHDKQAALVNMGKHLGIFREVHEVTGKDGGPIETADVSPRDEIARRIAGVAARLGTRKDTGGPE